MHDCENITISARIHTAVNTVCMPLDGGLHEAEFHTLDCNDLNNYVICWPLRGKFKVVYINLIAVMVLERSEHVGGREGLMKELRYGKCRIQHFLSLTHTSEYLDLCCFDLDSSFLICLL